MPQTNPWDHEKITIHIGIWSNSGNPWEAQQYHIKSPGMPDANPVKLEDMKLERDRRANYYLDQGYYVTYVSTVHSAKDYEP